jgi:integrase
VSPKLRLISWDSYSPLPSRLFPLLWRFPSGLPRLKLAGLDLHRCQLFIHYGKGAKNRVVYLSDHAYEALTRIIR